MIKVTHKQTLLLNRSHRLKNRIEQIANLLRHTAHYVIRLRVDSFHLVEDNTYSQMLKDCIQVLFEE